ncbi:MAG: type II toxin-antitoxin system HicA family toxin [Acidobacteriota bacterium]
MGQQDLPLQPGRLHIRVFESFGWVVRRSKKNHFVLTHPGKSGVLLSIPDHPEVARGTLRAQLRRAGLTDEEYRARFDAL